MKRYPHQLWAAFPAEAVRTVEGDFLPSSSNLILLGPCRQEDNAKGNVVLLEDGKSHQFDSLIHMPISTDALPTGTYIEVRQGDSVRTSGTVKASFAGQLHNRLWV